MSTNHSFSYLKEYAQFTTVKEMDLHVKAHVRMYQNQLKPSTREALYAIAKRALKYPGAAHLKAETIAKEIQRSTKSVYRAMKDLVEYGIISKENKPKKNGIKGANIYVINPCTNSDVSTSVPSKMSQRAESETPTESKANPVKSESQSLSLLNASKAKEYTKATKAMENLKLGLLEKLPRAIRQAVEPFFSTQEEIYQLVGAIFNGKKSVDKSIRIEDYEQLYYNEFMSVIEGYKRAIHKEKPFNIFKVIFKATADVTKAIITGATEAEPEPIKRSPHQQKSRKGKTDVVPQWFIEKKEKEQQEREKKIAQDKAKAAYYQTEEGMLEFEQRRQAALNRIQQLAQGSKDSTISMQMSN